MSNLTEQSPCETSGGASCQPEPVTPEDLEIVRKWVSRPGYRLSGRIAQGVIATIDSLTAEVSEVEKTLKDAFHPFMIWVDSATGARVIVAERNFNRKRQEELIEEVERLTSDNVRLNARLLEIAREAGKSVHNPPSPIDAFRMLVAERDKWKYGRLADEMVKEDSHEQAYQELIAERDNAIARAEAAESALLEQTHSLKTDRNNLRECIRAALADIRCGLFVQADLRLTAEHERILKGGV